MPDIPQSMPGMMPNMFPFGTPQVSFLLSLCCMIFIKVNCLHVFDNVLSVGSFSHDASSHNDTAGIFMWCSVGLPSI